MWLRIGGGSKWSGDNKRKFPSWIRNQTNQIGNGKMEMWVKHNNMMGSELEASSAHLTAQSSMAYYYYATQNNINYQLSAFLEKFVCISNISNSFAMIRNECAQCTVCSVCSVQITNASKFSDLFFLSIFGCYFSIWKFAILQFC